MQNPKLQASCLSSAARAATTRLMLPVIVSIAALLPAAAQAQQYKESDFPTLNTTTYWFGNTWGGREKWMQNFVEDIFVLNGRIYTNSIWDEAGSESGIYTTDGDKIGKCTGTHGWGHHGGPSVTADNSYIYISYIQQGEDDWRERKGEQFCPGSGKGWFGVARYDHSGNPAPFEGGLTIFRHMLVLQTQSVDDNWRKPTGLVIFEGRLYVSDPTSKSIKVYDTAELGKGTVREFGLNIAEDMPGELAMQPGRGPDRPPILWVIHTNSNQVHAYGPTGDRLYGITDCQKPVDLCFDAQGNLLIADAGLDRQQIRVYDVSGAPSLVETFGSPVYEGEDPGLDTPDRFVGITGVGADDAGNVYVSTTSGGSNIRKYNAEWKLQWRLEGYEFVDRASPDPADDTDVYSPNSRYEVDYARQTVGGPEHPTWRHVAWTQNLKAYPEDLRTRGRIAEADIRRINGQKFMFIQAQQDAYFGIYRFDGQIAVPAVVVERFPARYDEPWPAVCPFRDEPWMWVDDNQNGKVEPTDGDGLYQADEFFALGKKLSRVWGRQFDSNGTLWLLEEDGTVHEFPMAEINSKGVPVYSMKKHTATQVPEGVKRPQRLVYKPETDTMYLSYHTKEHPWEHWGWLGRVVSRYDNWHGDRKLRWTIIPPYNSGRNRSANHAPRCIDVEGDYVFIGYDMQAFGGWNDSPGPDILVFSADAGAPVGKFQLTEEVGSRGGALDMRYVIDAHQRDDGSYLLIVEEDWRGKQIFFLWDDNKK